MPNRVSRSLDAPLALLGVVAWCVGAFLIYIPAGFICAGVSAVGVAYVARYLEVNEREDPRTSD